MPPAVTALLTHVPIGASILFIIAYIGNRITFSNRFVNALVIQSRFAQVQVQNYSRQAQELGRLMAEVAQKAQVRS